MRVYRCFATCVKNRQYLTTINTFAEPLSAQKEDDDKNGGDGGNYLAETETAQTMPNRCVRLSV